MVNQIWSVLLGRRYNPGRNDGIYPDLVLREKELMLNNIAARDREGIVKARPCIVPKRIFSGLQETLLT